MLQRLGLYWVSHQRNQKILYDPELFQEYSSLVSDSKTISSADCCFVSTGYLLRCWVTPYVVSWLLQIWGCQLFFSVFADLLHWVTIIHHRLLWNFPLFRTMISISFALYPGCRIYPTNQLGQGKRILPISFLQAKKVIRSITIQLTVGL